MISDNGTIIFEKLRNKKAVFIRMVFDGKVNYLAANRAARRYLRSKGVQGNVNLGENSVC